MPLDSLQQITIGNAPQAHWDAALQLLFAKVEAEQRKAQIATTLAAAKRGEVCLRGLLEARRDTRLAGAVWGRLLTGRGALVWPPQLAEGEAEALVDLLFGRLDAYLKGEGVQLAQALLEPAASRDAERLERHGFTHATDLVYFVCFAERFPVTPPFGELQYDAYQERDRARLIRLIESTYVGTRDLPALNGVRDMDDVVEGYKQTGVFDGRRWLLARDGDRDVGCLLLTDHPSEDQWELMYMGLEPTARGRGWGLEMTRHGLWLAGQSGRRQVVLAADAANRPALRIYESAGFTAWNRRRVMLKLF
jgi:ribosomal protein S18 acetylase RimI-like enzyme